MPWPTTNNPKRNFVTLRMTDDEHAEFTAAAQVAGMSKSTFLRDCVARVIAADKRRAQRLKKEGHE